MNTKYPHVSKRDLHEVGKSRIFVFKKLERLYFTEKGRVTVSCDIYGNNRVDYEPATWQLEDIIHRVLATYKISLASNIQ